MPEEDFNRGQTKAHLENIIQDVSEIKVEIKEVNKKIDEVEASAQRAAVKSETAVAKARSQETIGTARHVENVKRLETIEGKIDSISAKQQETDGRVAKIYTIAAVIGGGAGLILPWIKDYFI